jgi:alpha-glucoside transport system permease protein
MGELVNALAAIVIGVGGVVTLFYVLNALVERLPKRWEERFKPYVFVGPAVFVVAAFLVYPALDTVRLSFLDADGDSFVGASNYQFLFTEPAMRTAIWNNVKWIVVVPSLAVAIGLAVATLADKLRPKTESIAKSVIFLPMAISFVGASTIWGFIYAWRPEGRPQIGLLNAIWVQLGGSPVPWLQTTTGGLNDFALMVIMIWLQAGFAMVLLSAAIKNVPQDTIEAARVDGATEVQIFWRVVVPQIASTIVVVGTTILILVLKVFDIVRVLTNGQFGTEVVANRFITELFRFRQFGRAAAIVVALIIATIPVMVWNIRRFREQEATR